MNIPKLPLGDWIEALERWLEDHLDPLFDMIRFIIGSMTDAFYAGLTAVPAVVIMILISLIAWKIVNLRLALFAFAGLALIHNLNLWEPSMQSLALVLTASILSIALGIPIGIACARSNALQHAVMPLLDFMQTMPAFVYLLPAVSFFSLGVVPGVIASVIFAIPPTIRLTNLGIRQVPAGFGGSGRRVRIDAAAEAGQAADAHRASDDHGGHQPDDHVVAFHGRHRVHDRRAGRRRLCLQRGDAGKDRRWVSKPASPLSSSRSCWTV